MQIRHNPVTFYLRTLLYMALALLLRLVTLLPLVCLFVFPEGSPFRWLALLCPVLMVFMVLPLRLSFADALVQRPRERYFSFDTALSLSDYGEKLRESVVHALSVLKWGIPLFAMLGYAYYCFKNIDPLTLLGNVSAIGKAVVGVWNAVANFFIRLFGSIHTLAYAGGIGEGLIVLGAILAVGVAFWLFGAMRNSAARYIWVLATRDDRAPRTEIRRRLAGRRGRQFGVAMLNLVLWLPFLLVVATTIKGVVGDLSTQLMTALTQKTLPTGDLLKAVGPLAFAFVCLYFPLLPARRYLTAAFATHVSRHAKPAKEPAAKEQVSQPVAPVAPALFTDLPQGGEHSDAHEAVQAPTAPVSPASAPAVSEPAVSAVDSIQPLDDGYAEAEAEDDEPFDAPQDDNAAHAYEAPLPLDDPQAASQAEPADPATFTIGQ